MKEIGFLLALVLSLVGSEPANAGVCSKFEYQIQDDPIVKARTRFNVGDNRFLAVHGITIMFPGLENRKQKPKSYEIIAGTDDNIEDGSCFSLRMDAISYAKKFNVEMESLIKKSHHR